MFLLFFGCAQNLHKNPVSPETAFFSNEESSIDPGTMNNNVVSDISSPKESSDPLELSEKADTENQKTSLAGPVSPENPENSSGFSHQTNSQNHQSEDSDQSEKIQSILDEALDFCQASQDFWQKGELENALEALDHAYALILTTDTTNNPKLIQQKEDLRFMISKRILEIYASRNIVVNGNHNAIPLVMNKHVELEINHFTKYGEKNFFINAYKRSGKYRPQIVSALKAAGMPVELSWLPLIESGFKVNALSRARALGLWQFIPSTGYKFGLKRDKYIDERIDPVKSTEAAIAYLKELHQIFGDWSTVLAAYNCGEGQVLRVIRSQNINYLDNFWDLYERLPRETARYVPRFMAALFIIKNPEKYGLNAISVDEPLEYENVMVSKQIHLKNIATEIGVPENTLRELNPELRYRILPQDNYPLRVPPGKSEVLLATLDNIPVSYPPQPAYVYHRIRPGESLSTIARRYRTSVRKIMHANNLSRSGYIVAGKKLKIPQRGTMPYRPKIDRSKDFILPSTHVVKSGDSLWNIANRYGTTTKKIQSLNNLQTTQLHIGQVLKIPGYKDEKIEVGNLKVYMVKRGDSPFDIAQLHNMPLERFLRINLLTPNCKIYPGQKLFIE
ncbi:MAG: LysM peptidoglycan-binding domain-containing protein [Deltaproteobacteria bacterium]|jgi:membrane-bound lytic murein transglycosylase D|nr:LysM peptidoglycan-binding domain-containing protein [Deltaproteobacteria bacterium]